MNHGHVEINIHISVISFTAWGITIGVSELGNGERRRAWEFVDGGEGGEKPCKEEVSIKGSSTSSSRDHSGPFTLSAPVPP